MKLTIQKIQNELDRLANHLEGTPLADVIRDIKEGIPWDKKEVNSPRIFITVEGGVIQDISSDVPVQVVVADFDVDGSEPLEQNKKINGDMANVQAAQVTVCSETIGSLFRQAQLANGGDVDG